MDEPYASLKAGVGFSDTAVVKQLTYIQQVGRAYLTVMGLDHCNTMICYLHKNSSCY